MLSLQRADGAPGSGANENKREAEAPLKFDTPPKQSKAKPRVFDPSKLTHRQSLKRSLVGVGGLEVRGRQRLTLTLMCHLMVAHLKCTLYDTTKKFCQAIIFSLMGHRPISLFFCII